jgi:hypothetical protein
MNPTWHDNLGSHDPRYEYTVTNTYDGRELVYRRETNTANRTSPVMAPPPQPRYSTPLPTPVREGWGTTRATDVTQVCPRCKAAMRADDVDAHIDWHMEMIDPIG